MAKLTSYKQGSPDITQLEAKVAELVRQLCAVNSKADPHAAPTCADVAYINNAIASTQYKIAKQGSLFLKQRNYTAGGQLRKVWHVIP